ncbi:MAG: OsmC family protein [Candidatus Omnitrophica bacterium]|nr:OsmC family protein [Candidatus Omnitrophota bacterium]
MYKAEVEHRNDVIFDVKLGNSQLTIDAKGKEGVTPLDILLASLASCAGVYIRKYAEGVRLDFGGFLVTAEAELSKESPFSFKSIQLSVDLKGVRFDERRKKALQEFIKNCPVHNTLKGNPEIAIAIREDKEQNGD